MGISRGQLAEIWAASRHCWGSLKRPEFPAVFPAHTIHLPAHKVGTGGAGSKIRVLFIQAAGLGHQSWQPASCVCIPINSKHHRSRLECKQSSADPRDKGRELPCCNNLVTWEACARGGTKALPLPWDVLCTSLPMQTRGDEGEPALPAVMRPLQQGAG